MSDERIELPAVQYVIRGPVREHRELVYDVCAKWRGNCDRKCPVKVQHPPECVVNAQEMIELVRKG